ncbi:hypothetical protein GW17_00012979 [Ensete ventricosum]|nr:hypothetical protein GW17_00012979 [Ensete ventricosum]
MEATTSSSTKPLLPNRASYTCRLSRVDDKLKSLWSYFKWIIVDQSDVRHMMIS